MEKDIHVSHKGQGAATNREKGQGVTRTRAGAAPCKNGLARTLENILNMRARILCNRNEKIIKQKFVLLKVASDKKFGQHFS